LEAHLEEKEILGFRNEYKMHERNTIISQESTLLDFIMSFLFKLIFSISTDLQQPKISSEIICNTKSLSIEYFKNTLGSEEARKELFQKGKEDASFFLSTFTSLSLSKDL
jgi:hypothetical protein